MRPWFTKFSGVLYDRRWLDVVEKIYNTHYRIERYLRNTGSLARVGMVFTEQSRNYGAERWQQRSADHGQGMYHALVEARIPFEMVNDRLLDQEHIRQFKLLILPNIATLSDRQCDQLRQFTDNGGSLLATFETSLYDENGKKRSDFGLRDLFGITYDGSVEGPMQNSYLRLRKEPLASGFHPVLEGLEDAYRIINTVNRINVKPLIEFPKPVTLIPTYPDLPMEHVYPRSPETDIRELYLQDNGKNRMVYFPNDIDRTFWQIMCADHGRLIRNTILWTLNEEPFVEVKGPGVIDVTAWRQENSIAVHLVNLTNPMMVKGPFRELIPVTAQVNIRLPEGIKASRIKLLISDKEVPYDHQKNIVVVTIPEIPDHEIIGIDL